MNIVIRNCRFTDLTALNRLYDQLHGGESTTTIEELQAAFDQMTAHPGCDVFVVEISGQVVGTYVLYILPNMTRNGRPAAILENMVVDEAFRGTGIGRMMLEHARKLAEERGCCKLSLTSNAKREEAHSFYEHCGMTRHGYSFRYTL